jgi:hypothetical protein
MVCCRNELGDDRCHATIDARIRGASARSISRRLDVSLDDIFDVLDGWATQTITHKLRFHTLALELARLDDLHKVFDAQARTEDAASGALVTKIGEERRILLGLEAQRVWIRIRSARRPCRRRLQPSASLR